MGLDALNDASIKESYRKVGMNFKIFIYQRSNIEECFSKDAVFVLESNYGSWRSMAFFLDKNGV